MDPTLRFSDRVNDYVRYRPGYPPEAIDWLVDRHGLRPEHAIADVGSGTGISARLFLERGHTVYGVEPNDAMRSAAERELAGWPGFRSIAGTAEQTGLPAGCVDWVVAFQAFHWFDVPRARAEFQRILRDDGAVALVWNARREDTPLLAEYEALLRRNALDYAQVKHQSAETDGRILQFFAPRRPARGSFPYRQVLDFDGLRGRMASSSYMPRPGTPGHDAAVAELRKLFDRHAQGGVVPIDYDTRVYVGTLG